jgi:hypothetical protein
LVERFVYTEDVRSSSLLSPTIFSLLSELEYWAFVHPRSIYAMQLK